MIAVAGRLGNRCRVALIAGERSASGMLHRCRARDAGPGHDWSPFMSPRKTRGWRALNERLRAAGMMPVAEWGARPAPAAATSGTPLSRSGRPTTVAEAPRIPSGDFAGDRIAPHLRLAAALKVGHVPRPVVMPAGILAEASRGVRTVVLSGAGCPVRWSSPQAPLPAPQSRTPLECAPQRARMGSDHEGGGGRRALDFCYARRWRTARRWRVLPVIAPGIPLVPRCSGRLSVNAAAPATVLDSAGDRHIVGIDRSV